METYGFLSGILDDFSEHADRDRSELCIVFVLHNFDEAILATPNLCVDYYRVEIVTHIKEFHLLSVNQAIVALFVLNKYIYSGINEQLSDSFALI